MRIKSKKSQREYGLLNSSDLKAAKYKCNSSYKSRN